jgi:hypothetical protein
MASVRADGWEGAPGVYKTVMNGRRVHGKRGGAKKEDGKEFID